MNFDRFRMQTAIEAELGCVNVDNWKSYLGAFKAYKLTQSKSDLLIPELKKDAADIYFKAIFSLADAINGIHNGRPSWSVVKIYYSIFYFMRCAMATKGYAFLKSKGIYTLKMAVDESPVKRDVGKLHGEDVRGDHKTTIATFISIFQSTDVLQTNTVDGQIIYNWLMELRNQVHYRERSFREPVDSYFYSTLFDNTKIKNQIETYMNDSDYVYCFDAVS
jgi:hypothetical protein